MKLLIAFDGSDHADAALRDLPRAGLPAQVDATVLSAADVFSPPNSANGHMASEAARAMERSLARIEEAVTQARTLAEQGAVLLRAEFPNWNVTAQAVADSPGWAILKCSEGSIGGCPRSNLIVVGAAGRSAIGRTLFGSVALKVLTNARCSVRVGRAPAKGGGPIRLVVGVDGSADSINAVRAVSQRNWPSGTRCRVVTAADTQLLTMMPGMDPMVIPPPQASSQEIANRAAEQLREAGLAATPVFREGDAAQILIQQAEEFGADCIFVGARGLRRLERFLLGSVSLAVAMRAPCSVEVVHP